MPLPWTTTPLQLLHTDTSFYTSRFQVWGAAGISAALIFYLCISIIVFVGTLFFGRRWQCSTLCLFNGFASEVFAPAIPLIGRKKNMNSGMLRIFSVLRWVFFSMAVFFTTWWALFLTGFSPVGDFDLVSKVELYKYLVAELLMMMFFWVAFIGRGYCYYCPLGTLLALVGKLAGQRIKTDNSVCIQCGQCNIACPMSIDIMSSAKAGKSVSNLRCVGCGHCIDSCPTKNLSYSTGFLDRIKKNMKGCR